MKLYVWELKEFQSNCISSKKYYLIEILKILTLVWLDDETSRQSKVCLQFWLTSFSFIILSNIAEAKDTLGGAGAPWIMVKNVDMLHFSPIPIHQLLFLKIWIPTICVISLFTFFYRILITLSWEKIFKVIMLKRNSDGIYPKSKLFRLPIKSFSRGKNF